jgi:hypothetical protein
MRDDLASLLSLAAMQEADDSRELLDRVVHSLLHAGLCLEARRHRVGRRGSPRRSLTSLP